MHLTMMLLHSVLVSRYYPTDRYCQILSNCAAEQLEPKVRHLHSSHPHSPAASESTICI
jgi:hypothetical protein